MIAVLAHGEPAVGPVIPLWIFLAGGALLGEAIGASARSWRHAASRYALAGSLAVTCVVHVIATPEHVDEGPAETLFFGLSALLLAWLALRAATRCTPAIHLSAFAVCLGLIVLYVAARELSLPFMGHGGYSLLGNLSKGAEALAATLAAAAAQPRRREAPPPREQAAPLLPALPARVVAPEPAPRVPLWFFEEASSRSR